MSKNITASFKKTIASICKHFLYSCYKHVRYYHLHHFDLESIPLCQLIRVYHMCLQSTDQNISSQYYTSTTDSFQDLKKFTCVYSLQIKKNLHLAMIKTLVLRFKFTVKHVNSNLYYVTFILFYLQCISC